MPFSQDLLGGFEGHPLLVYIYFEYQERIGK
jgi:hypothetical protein